MICMGAGTNHWFHSDETYRSFIALLLLCGCVGINGGGWAHYVGQEKIRTFAGWQQLAFGLDWRRPGRQAQGTSFYYTHTEQWRYDRLRPEQFASPLGGGLFEGMTAIDAHAKAVRMGWMPAYPQWNRNPLELADEGGADPVAHVVEELRPGACATRSRTRARRRTSRACSSSGARTCSAPRARARSTSCAT
jgi:nitrate reductase alpha subunit